MGEFLSTKLLYETFYFWCLWRETDSPCCPFQFFVSTSFFLFPFFTLFFSHPIPLACSFPSRKVILFPNWQACCQLFKFCAEGQTDEAASKTDPSRDFPGGSGFVMVRGQDWRQKKRVAEDEIDSITNSMETNLSKIWEIAKDREAWHAAVHVGHRVRHDLATKQH